ncbi:hypothetical protein [Flavobacterium psychrotrophum]|uniref:hypothetical protein n=1 Tax=Flavobacterium psychrotrophum TaxID=2294119 RepID=UPI000E32158F|nr:hypothetical protein [Flavobacterium psychrotrophum]
MRLLLLFPTVLILSIAGYNLFNELESGQIYFMAIALHASVTALCVLSLVYLLRSAFKPEYIETENELVTE